jgi:hypothetical protein
MPPPGNDLSVHPAITYIKNPTLLPNWTPARLAVRPHAVADLETPNRGRSHNHLNRKVGRAEASSGSLTSRNPVSRLPDEIRQRQALAVEYT